MKKLFVVLLIFIIGIPLVSAYDYHYIDEYVNYQGDFLYRRTITINQSMLSGTVSNFPMLLNITDEHLNSSCRSDGFDILFTDADNNILNYERESYVNGSFLGWINVTSLDNTTDNFIYMYYNDSDSLDCQNISGTWDSNFVAVYHMNDVTTNTIKDSTSNINHGTKKSANEPIQVDGKIGNAQDFDGVDDIIRINDNFNFNDKISGFCWVKNGTGGAIFGQYDYGTNNRSFYIAKSVNKLKVVVSDDGSFAIGHKKDYSSVDDLVLTNYKYVGFTFDNGELKLYIDGEEISVSKTYDDAITTIYNTNIDLVIGAYLNNNIPVTLYDGISDSIRFSNIARNEDWIKTEYNTMNFSYDGGFFSLSNTVDMSFFSIIGNVVQYELERYDAFKEGDDMNILLSASLMLIVFLAFFYYFANKKESFVLYALTCIISLIAGVYYLGWEVDITNRIIGIALILFAIYNSFEALKTGMELKLR